MSVKEAEDKVTAVPGAILLSKVPGAYFVDVRDNGMFANATNAFVSLV